MHPDPSPPVALTNLSIGTSTIPKSCGGFVVLSKLTPALPESDQAETLVLAKVVFDFVNMSLVTVGAKATSDERYQPDGIKKEISLPAVIIE